MNILLHIKKLFKNFIMLVVGIVLAIAIVWMSVDLLSMKVNEGKPREYKVIDRTGR